MKDEIVKVIRSPEAPWLVGKQGVVIHKEGGWVLVKIEKTYSDLRKKDIKVVKDP